MPDSLRFAHIQVQTASWCNRTCAFCPSGTFEIPKTFMEEAVYRRIVDELARLSFAGRFSPYLMNEPLLDKRLPDLIALARDALPNASIFISSNGDALSLALGGQLFDAGLDCLLVNLYDLETPVRQRSERIVAELARERDLPILNQPSFPDLIGGTLIRNGPQIALVDAADWKVEQLTNRAGNVPGAAVQAEPLAASCYRPFEQAYIRYNGEVVLCCCDWKGEVVFGDVTTTPLDEIFAGPVASRYRDQLGRNSRHGLKLCETCDFHGVL